MRIENEGSLRKLIPNRGYKLYSISTRQTYDMLYLGINDSIDNYREIIDEDYVDTDLSNRVKELEEVINKLQQKINL